MRFHSALLFLNEAAFVCMLLVLFSGNAETSEDLERAANAPMPSVVEKKERLFITKTLRLGWVNRLGKVAKCEM